MSGVACVRVPSGTDTVCAGAERGETREARARRAHPAAVRVCGISRVCEASVHCGLCIYGAPYGTGRQRRYTGDTVGNIGYSPGYHPSSALGEPRGREIIRGVIIGVCERAVLVRRHVTRLTHF